MVETGYENLLLVRLLLEMRIPSIRKSSVSISKEANIQLFSSYAYVEEGTMVNGKP